MRVILGILLFACSSYANTQIKLFEEPLKPLAVKITANFKLINTRNQTGAEIGRTDLGQGMIEPKYFSSPGTLSYVDESGQTIKIDVDVEPRGMRRRQYCQYKPLDVKFKNKPSDALFKHAAKSLEMVTHCEGEIYLYQVYNEYFAYRAKSAFLAPSFRVRMANVTYVDTTATFPTVTFPGIFLESKKDMAERVDAKVLKLTQAEEDVPFTALELDAASWASHYGDSFVTKIASRIRIYSKYTSLYRKVPLTLRQIVLEKFAKSLVVSYDVAPTVLVNVFPIQFNSGAVQMVEYDFDEAVLGTFDKTQFLSAVFEEYTDQHNIQLATYKSTKTKVQKDADKAEVLATIREIIKSYHDSGLEMELRDFNSPFYQTGSYLNAYSAAEVDLNQILADPDTALAFIY